MFTSVPTGPDDVDIAYDVEIEQVKIRTGNIVSAYGAYPMNKKSVTRLWDSDEFVRVGSTTVRLRDKDLDITKTFFSSGNVVTLHVGYCDDSKQHESLQLLTCDSSTQEACTLTCERLIGGMQNCGICGPEIGQSNAHTFVRRTQRRMDIEVGGGCGGFMPLFCIPALYSRDLYLVELYANKREPVTLLLGEDATNVRHITGSADSRWTVYADNREYVHLNTYILANNPPGTYRPVLLAEHALPLQVESL